MSLLLAEVNNRSAALHVALREAEEEGRVLFSSIGHQICFDASAINNIGENRKELC